MRTELFHNFNWPIGPSLSHFFFVYSHHCRDIPCIRGIFQRSGTKRQIEKCVARDEMLQNRISGIFWVIVPPDSVVDVVGLLVAKSKNSYRLQTCVYATSYRLQVHTFP